MGVQNLKYLIEETREYVLFQLENGVRFKVSPEDKFWIVTLPIRLQHKSKEPWRYLIVGVNNLYLHRVIAEKASFDLSNQIDHMDGDILNNCRWNLRPSTNAQNQFNSKVKKSNTLGVKGVSPSRDGKFRAQIMHNGVKISLGDFNTIEAAKASYDWWAKQLFGDYVKH